MLEVYYYRVLRRSFGIWRDAGAYTRAALFSEKQTLLVQRLVGDTKDQC